MKIISPKASKLDTIDMKILHALSRDARITITDLSDEVGLSKTPCNTRLKRLEKEGVILGYRALLDPVKMGLDHIAFVEVKLSDTRAKALSEFNEGAVGKFGLGKFQTLIDKFGRRAWCNGC